MREGDRPGEPRPAARRIRLFGTVGEPINPEAWQWYYNGSSARGRCTDRRYVVADRNRRHSNHPACPARSTLKPGSATKPFFGIQPRAWSVSERYGRATARRSAICASLDAWPGHDAHPVRRSCSASSIPTSRQYPRKYFTGDGCRRDADGYYWITGRVDDVINVAGHRHRHRRSGECAGRSRQMSPRPLSSAIRTTSKVRASTPMSP